MPLRPLPLLLSISLFLLPLPISPIAFRGVTSFLFYLATKRTSVERTVCVWLVVALALVTCNLLTQPLATPPVSSWVTREEAVVDYSPNFIVHTNRAEEAAEWVRDGGRWGAPDGRMDGVAVGWVVEEADTVPLVMAHVRRVRSWDADVQLVVWIVAGVHGTKELERALEREEVRVIRPDRLRVPHKVKQLQWLSVLLAEEYRRILVLDPWAIPLQPRLLTALHMPGSPPTLGASHFDQAKVAPYAAVLSPSRRLFRRLLDTWKSPKWTLPADNTLPGVLNDHFGGSTASLPWDVCADLRYIYDKPHILREAYLTLADLSCVGFPKKHRVGVAPQLRVDLANATLLHYEHQAAFGGYTQGSYVIPEEDWIAKECGAT